MVNMLSSYNKPTQIEDIDTIDFTQLYENVTKIYNFWEERIGELWNKTQALEDLRRNFLESSLYNNDYLNISLQGFSISDNDELIVTLENVFLEKENEEIYYFWTHYFKNFFTDEQEIKAVEKDYIISDFKVLDIKKIIKKRLELLEHYFAFKKDYEYEIVSHLPIIPFRIYCNIYTSGILSTANQDKEKVSFIIKYLRRELESKWNIEKEKMTQKLYRITTEYWYFDVIFRDTESNINWITNHEFLPRGIYLQFFNMKKEQTDEIVTRMKENIEKIKTMLKKQTRVKKLTKSTIKNLIMALASFNTQKKFMIDRTGVLMQEYTSLEKLGELYYAPMVVNLLSVILEDLENGEEDIFLYKGKPIKTYLDFSAYNDLLESIVEERTNHIKIYLKRRILLLYRENHKSLYGSLKKIALVYKHLEGDCTYIFDSVIAEGYGDYIDVSHINLFLDVISAENKELFIENVLLKLIKIYPLRISKWKVDDFELYTKINSFPLSEKLQKEFDNMLVSALSSLFFENSQMANKSFVKVIKLSWMNKYISDPQLFQDKYKDVIYKKYQLSLMKWDIEFIWTKNVDFKLYNNLHKDHISYFIENILIPDIFCRIHKDKTKKTYNKVEVMLKKWNLLQLLKQLGYPNALYKAIFNWEDINTEKKKICNKILWHWKFLENVEINDYTSKWLADISGKIFVVNQSNISEDDYLKIPSSIAVLSEDIQLKLVDSQSEPVLVKLAQRQDLTEQVQNILVEHDKDNVKIAYLETERDTRNNEVLEKIVSNSDEIICLLMLKRFPKLEEQVLEKLINHRSEKVRIEVAKRTDLPEWIQDMIAEDRKDIVKMAYLDVEREARSDEALEKIADNSDETACLLMLKRFLKLKEEVLEKLMNHRSEKVRIEVARRTDLSEWIQDMIAEDRKDIVKIAYLETERDTRNYGALEKIADNSDETACLLMLKRFPKLGDRILEKLVNHRSGKVRMELAKRVILPEWVQEKIAEDNKDSVKIAYLETERRERSRAALEIIASNSDSYTCLVMLKNFPKLMEWILEELMNHRSDKVRIEVARKTNLPLWIQEMIAEDRKDTVKTAYLETERKTRSDEILEIIASNSNTVTCLTMLTKFPKLEELILEKLLNHRSEKVRIEVARRTDLSEQLQKKLAENLNNAEKMAYLETEREIRSDEALEIIASNSNTVTCLTMLTKFPKLEELILEKLLNHRSKKVREETSQYIKQRAKLLWN